MAKVLFLCFSDGAGGADRASYRHLKGLQSIGVDAGMLVQLKTTRDESVRSTVTGPLEQLRACVYNMDGLPLRLYRNRMNVPYATGWLNNSIARRVSLEGPDLVHLEWVCGGFVPVAALPAFKRPLVWTLHDLWPLTGGCHYSQQCQGYEQSCGACPQLGSSRNWDLSRWTLNRKKKHWKDLNLTIVAISRWVGRCAEASALFRDLRIEVIPDGLDVRTYRPMDRTVARRVLGLPLDRKIILMGAVNAVNDPRKGFSHVQAATVKLASQGWGDRADLVIFGADEPSTPPVTGLKTVFKGHVHDDVTLTLMYSAADVFVAPSKEEALGQTIIESFACGTPAVAFDIGGIPDIIDHQQTGYLAKPFHEDDLARAIAWVLDDEDRRKTLGERARQKVEAEFDIERVARRYANLYEDILDRR